MAVPLVPGKIYDIYYSDAEQIRPTWRKKNIAEVDYVEIGLEYVDMIGNILIFNRISQEEELSDSGVTEKETHRIMLPYGWIKKFIEWPESYQPKPKPIVEEKQESVNEGLTTTWMDPPKEEEG